MGTPNAAWLDERNGNRDVYFAYRRVGGVWGPNVRVNDDTGSANQIWPSIAVDGSGNGYVVLKCCMEHGRASY